MLSILSCRSFVSAYLFFLIISIFSVHNTSYGQTTTITIYATGTTGSYNSGSVTSTGFKNDCDMTNINSPNTRGWASFVLPFIPLNSTLNSVDVNFTTFNSTASSVTNNLYGFIGSAASMSGTVLFANCVSGSAINTSAWIANATQTKSFNAAGLNFLGANLFTGTIVNIGFIRGSNLPYSISGYCSSNPPSLVITYTAPCFALSTMTLGNTLVNNNPVCLNSSFTLSVQNNVSLTGSGYSPQWQWSTDNNVWNDIAGANSVTYSDTWVYSGASRYYRLKLSCYSYETFSNPVQVFKETNFTNCYCGAGATINGCNTAGREYISNVKINTLNNASTCSNTNSYTNYSGLGTTLSQGSSCIASVTVANSFSSDKVRIWIDFNHNSSFADAGEQFDLLKVGSLSAGKYCGIITIPLSALAGNTKMRVRLTYGTPTTCGTSIYGEVEDYDVQIISAPVQLQVKAHVAAYIGSNPLMNKVLYNQDVETNSSTSNADISEIELREDLPSFPLVGKCSGILKRSGVMNTYFPSSIIGKSCYIVFKHRNTIETWSANPVIISTNTNYDFTTAANKAYGNNLKEMQPGVFACYSGDINQDENVDLLDLSLLETDINDFQFGYIATDINGDGNVDLLDAPTVETNINQFVFSSHP